MPSAQELVDSCKSLFSLPEIYLRVRDVVDAPSSTMDDLAKVLALDPAITARILQVVNSPLYGLPGRVGSLTQAVGLLGMDPIQDIVLTTSVATAFPKIPATVLNMADYWRKSVRCGLLADRLAKEAGVEHADEFFVVGLLRDVGHLVMYQALPERAESAIVEAAHLRQPVDLVEQETIGCDYTEVGAELMRRWGMPTYFQAAMRYQLHPEEAGEHEAAARILGGSGKLADALESRELAAALASEEGAAGLRILGRSSEQTEPVVREAEHHLQAMLALIIPKHLALAA